MAAPIRLLYCQLRRWQLGYDFHMLLVVAIQNDSCTAQLYSITTALHYNMWHSHVTLPTKVEYSHMTNESNYTLQLLTKVCLSTGSGKSAICNTPPHLLPEHLTSPIMAHNLTSTFLDSPFVSISAIISCDGQYFMHFHHSIHHNVSD